MKFYNSDKKDKTESWDAIEAETKDIPLIDNPHQLCYSIIETLDLKETKSECELKFTLAMPQVKPEKFNHKEFHEDKENKRKEITDMKNAKKKVTAFPQR